NIAPGERHARVARVVAEVAAAVARDLPQLTGVDQVLRVLDGGRVTVVEADDRPNPGGLDGGGNLRRLLRKAPERLLPPEMLPRCGSGQGHLAVHEVRRGDADRLDLWMGQNLLPVAARLLEAEP